LNCIGKYLFIWVSCAIPFIMKGYIFCSQTHI